MRRQHAQTFLRRMVRMTVNAAAMRPSCSETSSPSGCIWPPHSGQTGSGSSTCSSRGRCSGSASREVRFALALLLPACASRVSATPRLPVRSSSRVSSSAICRSSFSDLRPNCMRLSLSICALSRSISRSRSARDARASSSKALSASMSSGRSLASGMPRSLRRCRAVYNIDSGSTTVFTPPESPIVTGVDSAVSATMLTGNSGALSLAGSDIVGLGSDGMP